MRRNVVELVLGLSGPVSRPRSRRDEVHVADSSTTVPDSSTTVPNSSTTVPNSSTTVPNSSTTVPNAGHQITRVIFMRVISLQGGLYEGDFSSGWSL